MFKVVVAKSQYQNLENRSMARFFPHWTITTLAASSEIKLGQETWLCQTHLVEK